MYDQWFTKFHIYYHPSIGNVFVDVVEVWLTILLPDTPQTISQITNKRLIAGNKPGWRS